jgi:hypothetical protein
MNDLVSIITPTYNCGKFIAETIEIGVKTNIRKLGNDYH